MKDVQRAGQYLAIVDARSEENSDTIVKIGLRQATFDQLAGTGQATKCAQFYGLIQPGLVNAVHAFKGLKRPMMTADDMHADTSVVAYSWKPEHDYLWSGGQFGGIPLERKPPTDIVFVVLVRLFKEPESIGAIVGSIEHWSWIAEDPAQRFAPVDWNERYETHLWSKKL